MPPGWRRYNMPKTIHQFICFLPSPLCAPAGVSDRLSIVELCRTQGFVV